MRKTHRPEAGGRYSGEDSEAGRAHRNQGGEAAEKSKFEASPRQPRRSAEAERFFETRNHSKADVTLSHFRMAQS